MNLGIDFGQIKSEFKEIYESRFFPMYWIIGFALVDAYTQDWLWLLVGIFGGLFFALRRRT